jgi:adenylate cyclase
MGELLAFAGRPEEAEQWVRKSMSLNPYHPQRYWTHLARALFHQGRYAETGDALDQIGRPRSDDLAYAVAASAMLQDGQATARNVEALRVAFPDFSAAEFVDNLPYARDEDLDLLRDALVRTEF